MFFYPQAAVDDWGNLLLLKERNCRKMPHMTTTEIVKQAQERVPANLESLRILRRLTYRQLAEEAGMPLSAVHKRFKGKVDITAQDLAVFAAIFRIPITYLYLPEDEFLETLHTLGFQRFWRKERAPDQQRFLIDEAA
jgi:transcriptional regulator with XRE-family HTH domain